MTDSERRMLAVSRRYVAAVRERKAAERRARFEKHAPDPDEWHALDALLAEEDKMKRN